MVGLTIAVVILLYLWVKALLKQFFYQCTGVGLLTYLDRRYHDELDSDKIEELKKEAMENYIRNKLSIIRR